MVLSTPVKVASGVAAASTVTVGTVAIYKYNQFEEVLLFKPDENAMESASWNVTTITTSATEAQPKTFSFTVSITSEGQPSTSPWSCTLIASATQDGNDAVDSSGFKEDLTNYFGTLNDSGTSPTAITNKPTKEQKQGFVTSCAKNRKPNTTPSDTKVEGEVKFTLTKQTGNKYKFQSGELDTLFKGNWINK